MVFLLLWAVIRGAIMEKNQIVTSAYMNNSKL